MVKLYLVRHGQSTGNVDGALMGQSDHRLTALGEAQARAAAARLAPLGPMPVYSSDLPRAVATAELIAASWAAEVAPQEGPGGGLLIPDKRLREIDLGDYEGRPWEEFEADVALTDAFANDPHGTSLPHGESLADVEARVHAAVCDVLAAHGVNDSGELCANAVAASDASALVPGGCAGGPHAAVCLVAHDGPIRAILNHYLEVPPQKWWTLSTSHGGVSLLEFAGGCVTIRYVNATGHLDRLAGAQPGAALTAATGAHPAGAHPAGAGG